MTKTQREYFKGHHWQTVLHLNCEDKGVLEQQCKSLGIRKLVVTPKTKGRWGYGKVTYHIDGDEREFETLEALAVAKGRTITIRINIVTKEL